MGSEPEFRTMPHARSRGWLWVLVVVLIALVVGWYAWRANRAPGGGAAPAGAPIPVAVATAQQGEFIIQQSQPGTVVPAGKVVVRSRVQGELVRLLFTGGEKVKKGALLAEIDPQPFQTQLELAQADLARSQTLAANAAETLKHYQALLDENSIARQRVDDQQALVRQYAAEVKAGQSRVDSARTQLRQTRITAPISGTVGLRQVDPGNVVDPADARGITTVTQSQPSRVSFSLPASVAPRVLKALQTDRCVPVDALGDGQGAALAAGRLLAASNQVDPATGTVQFNAEFANEQGLLLPGQFVTVELPVQTLPDVVQVPNAAVQHGAAGAFVYVVQDGKTVAVTPVKTGPTDATTTVIDDGLQAGATVVVRGADRLRAGAPVHVAEEVAPAAPVTERMSACPQNPAPRS